MLLRFAGPLAALVFVLSTAAVNRKATVDQAQFPPTYVPSGQQMYRQYCAACHGTDAKGHGPAADSLKKPPSDLTTLAQRHGGSFPYTYLSDVLLFGPGVAAHGSANMPTWGPIFLFLDKHNETAVRQRIKNLGNYLASLQVGQKRPGHGTL